MYITSVRVKGGFLYIKDCFLCSDHYNIVAIFKQEYVDLNVH